MIPTDFKLKYDKNCIDDAISNVADKMNKFFNKKDFKNDDIVALTILKGAMFFSIDLMKKLAFNFSVDFLKASSYHSNKQSTEILIDAKNVFVKDKTVILLDDICDTGITLYELSNILKNYGAKEVYSAVLLKRLGTTSKYKPNWVGFVDKSKDWFVGYGMDDAQKWRQLPEIYVKKQ
ncbi:MAG: phosphoribosyltransferase [Bdellovibrionota bacterium]